MTPRPVKWNYIQTSSLNSTANILYRKKTTGVVFKLDLLPISRCTIPWFFKQSTTLFFFKRCAIPCFFQTIHNSIFFQMMHNSMFFWKMHNFIFFQTVHSFIFFKRCTIPCFFEKCFSLNRTNTYSVPSSLFWRHFRTTFNKKRFIMTNKVSLYVFTDKWLKKLILNFCWLQGNEGFLMFRCIF